MLKGEIANSKNMASPFNVCYCWSVSVSVIISYKNWNIVDFHAPTGALFYLLSILHLLLKQYLLYNMHILHIFINAYFIFDLYLWLVFVYIFVDVYRRMCVRESARESEKDRNIDRNKY